MGYYIFARAINFEEVKNAFSSNNESLSDKLSKIEISDERIEELWDGNEDEDEDKACAYEHIMGIKSNVKFCLENNLSLISFCH